MGTVVTIEIVGHDANDQQRRDREDAIARALGWFEQVERECSRFEPESVISKLATRAGEAVAVSALVYEAVRVALAVAAETDGAFDPTIGALLETGGFDENYRSGRRVSTCVDRDGAHIGVDQDNAGDTSPNFRDVHLDDDRRTVTLDRPLLLDLGAVAKGLAIDLAARELEPFENFVIDAGGDLYLAGRNAASQPWSVGIRHPRESTQVVETLRVSNMAVCTSGDYERQIAARPDGLHHHILDPRTGESAARVASVTVVASSAMIADALSTAAFVLGPTRGIALLEQQGVEGLIVTPTLERFTTAGMRTDFARAAPRMAMA